MTGVEVSLGRTAVVARGGIEILLLERPAVEWDPSLYRSAGLEPKEAEGGLLVRDPAGNAIVLAEKGTRLGLQSAM